MTLDHLKSAHAQLLVQQKAALDQAQALHGAIQMTAQLITQEETLMAGGNQPAQGITGPVI